MNRILILIVKDFIEFVIYSEYMFVFVNKTIIKSVKVNCFCNSDSMIFNIKMAEQILIIECPGGLESSVLGY